MGAVLDVPRYPAHLMATPAIAGRQVRRDCLDAAHVLGVVVADMQDSQGSARQPGGGWHAGPGSYTRELKTKQPNRVHSAFTYATYRQPGSLRRAWRHGVTWGRCGRPSADEP